MIATLSAYWQFLKKPHLLKSDDNSTMLWKDISWLLVLNLAFSGLVISVYSLLLKFNLITKYEEYDIFQYGFALAMVLGVIIAPVVEEFVFRWQLSNPKVSVWFVMISAAFLATSFTANEYARFFIFIVFFIVAIVVFLVIEKLSRIKNVRLFRSYYIFLFYYTAIIFGYVHMSNIKGLTMADPSFVIYISSQIFGGLALGYIRIKYGLGYSILMHGCFNLVMIPLAWLFN